MLDYLPIYDDPSIIYTVVYTVFWCWGTTHLKEVSTIQYFILYQIFKTK